MVPSEALLLLQTPLYVDSDTTIIYTDITARHIMGCGGSKLKGDDVPNLNSQPVPVNQPVNQPIKKVNTNFSTIDYDQDAQHRRLTEYAPHETPRAPSLKHDMPVQATEQQQYQYQEQWQESSFMTETFGPSGPGPLGSTPGGGGYPHDGLGSQAGLQRAGGPTVDGAALKPYQTNDPTDWDRDRENGQRRESHHRSSNVGAGDQDRDGDRDPTSSRAKDEFAEENDPATQKQHQHHDRNGDDGADGEQNHGRAAAAADSDDDDDEKKKTWLGQKYASFQSAKQGKGVSDDDLKAYTGKDRAEFDEWTANQPGVGGRQASGVVGSDGAYASPYVST
ncbi:hypothetical protein LTR13_006317 [Exophiala sideris]|nr:hypothetical protein LTR13_006317 [Exophiala sideris]